MSTNAPVGYTYKAEQLCPNCTLEKLKARDLAELMHDAPEGTIALLADRAGIDYSDSHSYDSDDFPKPIFAWGLNCNPGTNEYCDGCNPGTHEYCDGCHTALCDY